MARNNLKILPRNYGFLEEASHRDVLRSQIVFWNSSNQWRAIKSWIKQKNSKAPQVQTLLVRQSRCAGSIDLEVVLAALFSTVFSNSISKVLLETIRVWNVEGCCLIAPTLKSQHSRPERVSQLGYSLLQIFCIAWKSWKIIFLKKHFKGGSCLELWPSSETKLSSSSFALKHQGTTVCLVLLVSGHTSAVFCN